MSVYQILRNNQILDFRAIGDLGSDSIWTNETIPELRDIVSKLHSNSDLSLISNFDLIPSEPDWLDWNKIVKAQNFFAANCKEILALLGFAALPYCYAHANGAKVLAASSRLLNDTNNRLLETSTFVFDCCRPNSFDDWGNGYAAALKVRLIHSMIRYYIKKGDWDQSYGYPVNQMDVAGTNMAFSLITIRGMRNLGITVSDEEADAYLHLWNYISYLMGLDGLLIPHTLKEAHWLTKKIYEHEVRTSKEGRSLTAAMIAGMKEQPEAKDLKSWIEPLIQFSLGDECAAILGIESSKASSAGNVFKAFRTLSNLFGTNDMQSNQLAEYDKMIKELDEKPSLNLPRSFS
ncbi:MAG: DUF2236 domain-containing protein [bacterium]|nr:DUF2236 domain-containing protein [bacterium]